MRAGFLALVCGMGSLAIACSSSSNSTIDPAGDDGGILPEASTVHVGGNDGGSDAGPSGPQPPPNQLPPTNFQLLGRFAPNGDGGYRAVWTGSGVHAKFQGTSISIDMASTPANQYEVVIDGTPTAMPVSVLSRSRTIVPLAMGLSADTHDLIVFKRNEADKESFVFYGLSVGGGGKLVPSSPPFAHRIEFIGDSITAGYGDLGLTDCKNPDSTDEDGYLSYAAVAARMLNADVHVVAYSGQGAYRNYQGDTSANAQMETWFLTSTAGYDNMAKLQPGAAWDFTTWTADAVVVNLGTNDFHGSDPGQPFVDAYVHLLKTVRSKYPGVPIYLGIGPIMSDADRPKLQAYLTTAINTLKSGASDTSIQLVTYGAVTAAEACDSHPTVKDARDMATILANQIHTTRGWAVDTNAQ